MRTPVKVEQWSVGLVILVPGRRQIDAEGGVTAPLSRWMEARVEAIAANGAVTVCCGGDEFELTPSQKVAAVLGFQG